MSRVLFVALCNRALDPCYQVNFPIQGLVLNSQPNLKLFNQLYWVVTTAIAQCDKRGHFRFSWKKRDYLTNRCVNRDKKDNFATPSHGDWEELNSLLVATF